MRLRYLHIANLPPLDNLSIVFGRQSVLERAYAIHFVVGVNGSGKSRLLQALTQIFLYLERPKIPPFPCTIAYDLGTGREARTIVFHVSESSPDAKTQSALIEFDKVLPPYTLADWETMEADQWRNVLQDDIKIRSRFVDGDLPGEGSITAYLPKVLVAYTSGMLQPWHDLFSQLQASVDTSSLLTGEQDSEDENSERPLGWNQQRENERNLRNYIDDLRKRLQESNEVRINQADLLFLDKTADPLPGIVSTSSIGYLIDNEMLPLATCAVALHQMVQEFCQSGNKKEQLLSAIAEAREQNKVMPGLRGLLNTVAWLWPESLHLRIRFEPDLWTEGHLRQFTGLDKLYKLATAVIREPEPSVERLLCFDLFNPSPSNSQQLTCQTLFDVLSNKTSSPFRVFQTLVNWKKAGLIQEVIMTVKKDGVADLLLYDWLSDGERLFLGRMALLHLLTGQEDSLIILDEPETHFNDVWKRQIVDIIDDNLRKDASEAVLSTHSSIALTDAFDEEIVLLRKYAEDGYVAAIPSRVQTFGASPNEIMRDIFGTPYVVGQRATEFLDMVLTVAASPDLVQEIWSTQTNNTDVQNIDAFRQLWENVQKLPHTYEGKERLIDTLHSIKSYAQTILQKEQITVAEALTVLEDKLGPGYYQFEFRRRLRILTEQ